MLYLNCCLYHKHHKRARCIEFEQHNVYYYLSLCLHQLNYVGVALRLKDLYLFEGPIELGLTRPAYQYLLN